MTISKKFNRLSKNAKSEISDQNNKSKKITATMSLIAANNRGDDNTRSTGNGLLEEGKVYKKYDKLLEAAKITRAEMLTANATRQQMYEYNKDNMQQHLTTDTTQLSPSVFSFATTSTKPTTIITATITATTTTTTTTTTTAIAATSAPATKIISDRKNTHSWRFDRVIDGISDVIKSGRDDENDDGLLRRLDDSKNRWQISNPPSPPYHYMTSKAFDDVSDRYFLSNAFPAKANANILPSTSVATILPTFVSVSTRLLPAIQSATNVSVPMQQQKQSLLSQSKSTSSELLLPPDDDSYSVSVSPSHLNTVSSSASSSSYYQHPLSSSSNSSAYLTTPSASASATASTSPSPSSLFCNCCNNFIARCCFGSPFVKAVNVRRCVLALFAITVMTIFYYTHYVDTGVFVGLIQRDTRPTPIVNCRMTSGKHARGISPAPDHRTEAGLRIDPKVLVFVETTYSQLGRNISELLVYNRIKYKIEVAGKSLPSLTNLDKGRYGVIVFENLDKYLHMDKWNRELLDKYCREYSVGVIGFVSPSEETLVAAQLRGFPVFVHTNLRLRDASLNPASPVLRLTRAGETAWGALPGDDWAVFQHNHSTYEPIEWAQRNSQDYPSDSGGQVHLPLTTVLQDHGQLDGIKRILFGSNLHFWLHRLLFLDALSYLSHGQLSLSLERMILVDIDDIFVGEKGTRLRPDDVRALIATQKIIASMVPGFRFNLGFSGKYHHHGTHEENLGDDFLLQNVHEFTWFSHMWKHQQPHLYDNITLLISEMQLNHAFAEDHNIPTTSGYSISPHHSGVYPAHEILYEAWQKVWNIKVTSTEEYPHLRPARLRRGFIHRNIMVLPRQTCGLFTHTMYIDRYPGGRDKLDESIQGGELFQTIVYNPINIFMTHMSNYGSDRLALYTFQSVIKFLQCWTNLKLASAPPIQLAEMYFRLHPEEVDPVWGNPCDDPRHRKIWSKSKNCDSLPKFLVIGPQKTGTTALYTFLSMHSSIASNVPSPDSFEEIQFFNGKNYYRGLDWYMDFFPMDTNASTIRYMFEKSATYFDGETVPKRAHALLPHAKIVTILISPAKRAYSWYQHQRAHSDAIANNYSFYQVITAADTAPKALRDLRNRCLNPGKYAQYLERWLSYYTAQQLHIIDGEQLRLNPVDVMNDLQRFLKIQPAFDYSNRLRYDIKKGFYCQIVNEKRNKCLGKSKGRQYPPMDERSAKLLQRYYLSHNTALVKLMKKLGARPIPQWLKDDLSTGT
ncbi:bifunctional heparan sulfate N-deacetylase/N-sulfotransferase [Glossina fuscipes]|uniref:[heparan sulfate]-glucosamine N-sulfotransferase n=1 Tax=Glossina fuscipes TaxID=7396 RepID=A0A8U0W3H8_9MUSC|nr:bifunctional heparan sulfate N-deacetylase/N-sulfotransferase [Glossina fuscipes]XP_037879700.1 bifunctional heparan sulfate N-deacetylase/N-sulfotransferase [Glossina fuscipes]XP_037879701.1 bifunctional heparan sulfate N-deacetylase/N-sulfotransferase [Glossina fuscipes]XP_037879703.1 bifunctional heparan sulfate N-deacetylase/N-sulfotransferase [Glossina fuscipes]